MTDHARIERIIDWWHGDNPKPPELAFTAGPERAIADLLWTARLTGEANYVKVAQRIERLEAALNILVTACRTSGRMIGYNSVAYDQAVAALGESRKESEGADG